MDNKRPTILKNGTVFTKDACFEKLDICFSDGRIDNISASSEKACEREIDCSECYVIPALTDIHFHGCCGHDFCDASEDSLKAIAEYEYSCGVTQICPATMTIPENELEAVLKSAAEYKAKKHEGCAELVGVNLEGPFISPEKAGAQKPECISIPSPEKLDKWQNIAHGLIKLVTVAPEISGALEMIEQAADRYHFSLGHSSSGYSSALRAFNAGADHVTHLFNAMEPFHHRDTGIIGAASDSDCFVELICDGVHVSPSAVRMAFKLFSDNRIVLISDSMEATGMKDGTYKLGGQQVSKHGASAALADGTLAGSISTLYDCFIKCIETGIPMTSAIKAAAVNPCRSIGIYDRYGSIEVGKKAAFLILDKNDLSIVHVIG